MIVLRKGEERAHVRRRKREQWRTFSPEDRSPFLANGFGSLTAFEEGRLPPRASHRQPNPAEAEILTYVREGTLAYEDSTGATGLLSAGEFQRMTANPGIRYGETNTSATDWAHVFQLWLRPSHPGLEPGHEQKRFTAAERSGTMCMVASPDGRTDSLRLHQDAFLYSAILERGQHVIHGLPEGRCAWLHMVEGAAHCGATAMQTGDGAGISAQPAVSFTANEDTEVLLLDLVDET